MITTNDVSELLSSEYLEDKILGLIMLDSSDDWEDSDLPSYDKQFRSTGIKTAHGHPFDVVISKEHVYVITGYVILRAKKHVYHVFHRNSGKIWIINYNDESVKLQ